MAAFRFGTCVAAAAWVLTGLVGAAPRAHAGVLIVIEQADDIGRPTGHDVIMNGSGVADLLGLQQVATNATTRATPQIAYLLLGFGSVLVNVYSGDGAPISGPSQFGTGIASQPDSAAAGLGISYQPAEGVTLSPSVGRLVSF